MFYSLSQVAWSECLWWNLDSVPLMSVSLKGLAFSYCWSGTSFAIIVRCWKLTFFLCYLLSVTRCTRQHKTYQVCQSCERGKRHYWSAVLMESVLESLSHNRYFSLFSEFAMICVEGKTQNGLSLKGSWTARKTVLYFLLVYL